MVPSGCCTTMMSMAPAMCGVNPFTALRMAVPPITTPLCSRNGTHDTGSGVPQWSVSEAVHMLYAL